MKSKKYVIYVKKSFVTIKTRKIFHNGSTYDYHFVIKKLAEEFEGEFECLGEKTERYVTFSVPLKKENDNGKKITYKLKFIESYRFVSTLLSNLVDSLSGVYDKECTRCTERKRIRLNCEFIGFKNGRLNYKCKECKKSQTKLTNESIKNFPTLYKFCNGDLNKLFLLLKKIFILTNLLIAAKDLMKI